MNGFAHIDNWVFDLDNTLYDARTNLFALIDERMGIFIAELLSVDRTEARRIQKDYFYRYGTTLAGLMHDHQVDPHAFLDYVHDIDLDRVAHSPGLAEALVALPGRKLIFTNADRRYAERVLERLGLDRAFEAIHDIHASDYRPKPEPQAYCVMIDQLGIEPHRSLFVEDMARNLKPAKALGMTTAWLDNGSEMGDRDHHPDYIDHEISARLLDTGTDTGPGLLEGWLKRIGETL